MTFHKLAILQSLVVLVLCAFSVVNAASIDIGPWEIPADQNPYAPQTAQVGDTITFEWELDHNVYYHPSGLCIPDGDEVELALISPFTYTFTEGDAGKDMLFVCEVGTHCDVGMQVLVSVEALADDPTQAPAEESSEAPIEITDAPTPVVTDEITDAQNPVVTDGTQDPVTTTAEPFAESTVPPTQSPVMEGENTAQPSIAPAGVAGPTEFRCHLCVDPALRVTNSSGILPTKFFGNLTCGEWEDLASEPGVIAPDLCSEIQASVHHCSGCEAIPPSVAPTVSPPTSEAPVEFYVCPICGTPGYDVTIPDAIVSIPSQPDRTCSEVQEEAEAGFIQSSQCPIVETYVTLVCACEPTDMDDIPRPTTTGPVETPSQTPPISSADGRSELGWWCIWCLLYLPLLELVTRAG